MARQGVSFDSVQRWSIAFDGEFNGPQPHTPESRAALQATHWLPRPARTVSQRLVACIWPACSSDARPALALVRVRNDTVFGW